YDPDGAYTYEHSYSVYQLHARAAADGSALASVQVARLDTTGPDFKKYRAYQTLPDGPGILGPQADVLWLWNNGPEARDARTLQPIWTVETLAARSPATGKLLPDDPKYAKVVGAIDQLVLKTTDARYVRVDRTTGDLQPVDEASLAALSEAHTKTADTAFP